MSHNSLISRCSRQLIVGLLVIGASPALLLFANCQPSLVSPAI
jgi:hypothetical protein